MSKNNKKLLRKEIEKGSSPSPRDEWHHPREGLLCWVRKGPDPFRDPGPQLFPRAGPEQLQPSGTNPGECSGGGKAEPGEGPVRRHSPSHGRGRTLWGQLHVEGQRLCGQTQPGLRGPHVAAARAPGSPPDSPNCPPALFSAPSLLLPNCMSESRVRGDMGRSMVLLKEVLSEGEKAQKPPESGPGQSSLTSPLPAEGPPGTAQRPPELSRGKGPRRGRTGLWFGQQPEPGSAPHHHPRLGTPQ